MERVWAAEAGATVPEIHEQLQAERDIAYTTVMSTIHNLHRKGRLTREREGRTHRYRATSTKAEHLAHLMSDALAGAPDADAVLSHFVERIDPDDTRRLTDLLARANRRRAR